MTVFNVGPPSCSAVDLTFSSHWGGGGAVWSDSSGRPRIVGNWTTQDLSDGN